MTRDVSPSTDARPPEPLLHEDPSTAATPATTRRRHAGTERLRAFLKKPVAVAAACFLAIEIAVSLFAPWIAPYNPDEQDLVNRLQGSTAQHWLGTDAFGRDALSRLIYGGRISLSGAAIAVVVACIGGVSLGLLAGYVGRSTDLVLSRIIDVIMSVPGLILAITIVAVLGPGLVTAMIAIGIASIPGFYRITRGQAQVITSEVFVEASRMIGCTRRRIIWHHVLPNMWSPIIVLIALALGVSVTAEAALSFIGLGVQPPTASWGSMLQGATTSLNIAPILVIAPGVAIALTVLAFQLIGNGLRDAFGSGRESVMTA
jgi:peptide/nickel transport system permease protein